MRPTRQLVPPNPDFAAATRKLLMVSIRNLPAPPQAEA
jgi:hypothetical protein